MVSDSERARAQTLLKALLPLMRQASERRTLSVGKTRIMHHLESHGRATAAELASLMRYTAQAVSLAVRELEKEGLIARSSDQDDRRRTWIVMTPAGRDRLAREDADAAQELAVILADLPEAERAVLDAAAAILTRARAAARGEE